MPPLELSVLGLVRHMMQMEHVYLSWGLGGGKQRLVYGDDDYAGGSIETVAPDVQRYFVEVQRADRVIADFPSIESEGRGQGWPLGAALAKMIDGYVLHSGHSHMPRYTALEVVVR